MQHRVEGWRYSIVATSVPCLQGSCARLQQTKRNCEKKHLVTVRQETRKDAGPWACRGRRVPAEAWKRVWLYGSGWWVGIGRKTRRRLYPAIPGVFHLELSIETVSQEEKNIRPSRLQPRGSVTMGMRLGIEYGIAPPGKCWQKMIEHGRVKRVDVLSYNLV